MITDLNWGGKVRCHMVTVENRWRRRTRTRSCRHHRPHPFAKNAKGWGSLFSVAARMGQPPRSKNSARSSRMRSALLERAKFFERACVAGSLLFLSARRNSFVGSAALCGVESGACGYGVGGGGVAMVERCGALRQQRSGGCVGNGALAEALDNGRMEAASRRRGIGQRCGYGAAIHAHGKAPRLGEICCRLGAFHYAGPGSAQGRQA